MAAISGTLLPALWVGKIDSQATVVAEPSTGIYVLGSAAERSADADTQWDLYGPPKQQSILRADDSHLPVLHQQMAQALDQGPTIENLSQSLIDFLQSGQSSVHQSLDRYTYANMGNDALEPSFSQLDKHSRHVSSALSFSLTTKDGDTLTFNLHYEKGAGSTPRYAAVGYESVSVDYELEGRLSRPEQDELLTLADKIIALANDYFRTGKLDLDSLDLGSLTQVADLSLSLDGGMTDLEPPLLPAFSQSVDYGLSLRYSDNEKSRQLEAVVNGDRLKLELDKFSLADNYDLDRRAAALAQYRQMLVEGVARAGGSDDQSQLLLAAFDALHGELEEPEASINFNDEEASLLTAVSDFQLSFLSRVGQVNSKPERAGQAARFSLDMSQETQVMQAANGDRDIDQNQFWKLKGTYFKPLEGDNFADLSRAKQDYRYYQLQEKAAYRTSLERRDGVVSLAEQEVTFDARLDELVYKEGVLLEWNTQRHSLTEQSNLLARLAQFGDDPDAAILDTLILDAPQLYKRADEETTQNNPDLAPDELLGRKPLVWANAAAGVEHANTVSD